MSALNYTLDEVTGAAVAQGLSYYSNHLDQVPAKHISLAELAKDAQAPTVAANGMHPAKATKAQRNKLKAQAALITPFNGNAKTKEAAQQASYSVIAQDHDDDNKSEADIRAIYAALKVPYLAFTTSSHTDDAPRWKVLIPLAAPCNAEQHGTISRGLAQSLNTDTAQARTQQGFYAPHKLSEDAPYSFIDELDSYPPVDIKDTAHPFTAEVMQGWAELEAIEKEKDDAAALAPVKKLQPSNTEGAGIIGKISEYFSHDMRGVMQQRQYKGNVGKMLRPYSSSGAPAVRLFNEGTPEVRAYSHHGADDPLSALNHNGHALDLPAVICALDFNNDISAMVKHYAPIVDPDGQKERIDDWRKKKAIEKNIFFSHGFTQNEAGDWIGDASGEPPPAEVLEKVSQAVEQTTATFEPIPDSWDLAADAKPARYLVDGILEEDAHGILGGASMTYKSFLVKRLAYSLCSGTPFAGREVYKAGAVVYVCGEGQGAINRRLKALLIKHGKPKHPIHVITSGVSLTCPDSMGRLLERIKPLKPVLVIFDTFASLSGGIEENSNSEVGEALNRVRDTCRIAGASSLIVHHFGKNAEQGFRGASAFTNNVDFAFTAHKRGGEDAKESGLTCHKMKDGEAFKEMFFKADVVPLGIYDQKGKESTSLILEHDSTAVPNKPLTQDEIMLRELKHLQNTASITSTTEDPSWITWKAWSTAAKEYDVKNLSREKDKLIARGQVAENKGKFRAL